MTDRASVLFVCLGNICRSPLAEGVFRDLARERGVEDRYEVDSAGTGAYHVGEAPDARSREVAAAHGIELLGSARQLVAADLERFDFVIAMDRENLDGIRGLGEETGDGTEVHLLREFDPEAGEELEVPDPYYGGRSGFENVYRMVERSCRELLGHLERNGTPLDP